MSWLIDNGMQNSYSNAVKKATEDDEYFKIFKSQGEYNSIVGMGSVEQVLPFISFIEENCPEINEYWKEIAENDKYGGLGLFKHHDQNISVNTLRYAKTAAEIYKYIGSLHGKVVTEIGVGYGGLAYVLSRVFDIEKYNLVDLPEVQNLALKYIGKL